MFFIIIIVFNYTKYCMLPMWHLEEIKLTTIKLLKERRPITNKHTPKSSERKTFEESNGFLK